MPNFRGYIKKILEPRLTKGELTPFSLTLSSPVGGPSLLPFVLDYCDVVEKVLDISDKVHRVLQQLLRVLVLTLVTEHEVFCPRLEIF